ncbi:MAG: peptidoglycan editing factor PgeF [Pseudomonadota bacterium]
MTLIRPQWPAPANVYAFSTTRETATEQLPEASLGLPAPCPRQVHGADVLRAESVQPGSEADALYTAQPGILCQVVTADCLPVLFTHRSGDEVAAAHAGWRGLVAGVLEATVAAMQSAPDDLLTWIGPAISAAHYQVGAELLDAFLDQSPAALHQGIQAAFSPDGDRYRADLTAIAYLRLRAMGITSITAAGSCTYADAARFFSYRRDGKQSGRIITGICRLPTDTDTPA